MINIPDYVRCQQLLCSFWSAMDHRRTDELMSLITDDMRWQRERMYEGRTDIRTAIEARPANLQIRHLMTNLTVRPGTSGYDAEFILAPVFAMTEAGATPPYASDLIANVAEFRAGIVETNDGLRVSSITFEMLFQRAPAEMA